MCNLPTPRWCTYVIPYLDIIEVSGRNKQNNTYAITYVMDSYNTTYCVIQ